MPQWSPVDVTGNSRMWPWSRTRQAAPQWSPVDVTGNRVPPHTRRAWSWVMPQWSPVDVTGNSRLVGGFGGRFVGRNGARST